MAGLSPPFRCTDYYTYTRRRPDRVSIRDEWIVEAITRPIARAVQRDGRIRCWTYIEGAQRYLRVVLLSDGVTVHNAFFDRRFMP